MKPRHRRLGIATLVLLGLGGGLWWFVYSDPSWRELSGDVTSAILGLSAQAVIGSV